MAASERRTLFTRTAYKSIILNTYRSLVQAGALANRWEQGELWKPDPVWNTSGVRWY
jgi:hypothetical protein